MHQASFFCVAIVILGALFKIMHYPGASIMLLPKILLFLKVLQINALKNQDGVPPSPPFARQGKWMPKQDSLPLIQSG